METADLVLLPWPQARRRLGSRAQHMQLLTPPYPAIGGGELRVLRVRENGDHPLEIVCGYERYRRP
jgi:hypothetical protein